MAKKGVGVDLGGKKGSKARRMMSLIHFTRRENAKSTLAVNKNQSHLFLKSSSKNIVKRMIEIS